MPLSAMSWTERRSGSGPLLRPVLPGLLAAIVLTMTSAICLATTLLAGS